MQYGYINCLGFFWPIIDLFPGPTVEARSGDTLMITVTNALADDEIALHWHGLHVASM